jgi:molybdate transport system ATP-binding protein
MILSLESLSVPLAEFELAVTATMSARVTGIFGPSGAGKTSLLDAIAGVRKLNGGRIVLSGTTLDDVAAKKHVPPQHRGIGYVPQETALFPHMSVLRNVRYGMKEEQHESFDRILEVLEIRELLDRSVRKISGGEQKRVALARALLASPRVLLLDEPLAGLERPLQERITDLLLRIRDELHVPMLYVTHDAHELARIADETVVLERGRVVERA